MLSDQSVHHARRLASVHREFGALLAHYLRKTSFYFSASGSREVMTLGCGECFELESMLETLGGDQDMQLVGVDLDVTRVTRVRERALTLDKRGSTLTFLALDGVHEQRLSKITSSNDLVVFRHQNYWFDPKAWTAMFSYALGSLTPGGAIFLTSYFEKEHSLALRALRACGGRIVLSERNPRAVPLAIPGKLVDGFCAVVCRAN